jgi:hypothetical protein
MKAGISKKDDHSHLIREKVTGIFFKELFSSIIDDIMFFTNKLAIKSFGRFIHNALGKILDGIASIISIISNRPLMNQAPFPSLSHVLILFAFIFITRLLWVVFTHPYASYGALEEQLLELTAAKNFVQYGFVSTFFLPDYVSSNIQADHSVVYTHMPPLAAIMVAFLLKVEMSAFGIRMFFILLNTLGFFYGYLLFKKLFNAQVSFCIILLLSVNFYQSFEWSDHFDYSLIWFYLFGAAYYFVNSTFEITGKRKKYECLFFSLIVLMTSLTSYVMLLTQVVLLVLFYVANIARPSAKYLLLPFIAIMLGISLHLMQNISYFGWPQFQEEITLTLKNRIYGQPSTSELKSYFFDHNIVNWGAAGFDLKTYINELCEYVKQQLLFGRGYGWLVSILLMYTSGYNIRDYYGHCIYIFKILVSFFGAAISWYIIFPAHAQGYLIPVFGWGAISAIIMGGVCVLSIQSISKESCPLKTAVIFLLILLLVIPVFESMKRTGTNAYKEMNKSAYKTISKLGKYSSEVIWTNLTSVYVGYFTHSVVPGRCTIEAIKRKDLSFCDSILINSTSTQSRELLKKPTLFVYSKNYLSGNMRESTPEQLEVFQVYLKNNFRLIEKIDDLMIFKIEN